MADSGIFIKIDGDSAGFSKALGKAKKGIKDFDGESKKLQVSLRGLTSAFAVVAGGATALAGGLSAVTISAANNAKEISNLSRVAGIGAEEFQAFAYASSSVGIEQDKLSDILKDVNDRAGELISEGGGEMAALFEALGVSVEDAKKQINGLTSQDTLQLLVNQMQQAGFNAQQLTAGMEMIASDAVMLLPLLQDNGAALAELNEEAKDIGAVLSATDITELEEAAKAITRLETSFSSLANELAINVAPIVTDVADGLTKLLRQGREEADKAKLDEFLRQTGVEANLLDAEIEELNKEMQLLIDKNAYLVGQDFLINNQEIESKRQQIAALSAEAKELRDSMEAALGVSTADAADDSVVSEPELPTLKPIDFGDMDYELEYDNRNDIIQQKEDEATAIMERAAEQRRQIEQMEMDAKFTIAKTGLGALSLLFDGESKKGFEAQKKIAYAQTLVSGYQAAQAAYTGGVMATGQPWVGAAYAGASVLATVAQLQGISKTQYNSSGGSPSRISDSSSSIASSASAATTQQNVTINATGDFFSRAQLDSIIEQINESVSDGATIRLQ